MKNISRRQFTKATLAMTLGATGISMQKPLQDPEAWMHPWNLKTDPEAIGLTSYLNHGNLFVRFDNQPVLNYRAYESLKYPYFSPLIGPLSGLPLTSESALPYPHHRGLWLGCQPLNDGDYWGDTPLNAGHILSTDMQLHETGKDGIVHFTDHCKWVFNDTETLLEDQRIFKIRIHSKEIRLLDCQFTLTALKDISIDRAKHSFFAIRTAPDIAPTYGGTLMNSEGALGAKGTYGKPARWCSYFGKRLLRPDIVEGVAIMNHPGNFGGNCPWFTRDYGHMSAQPFVFRKEPFRLRSGETLELRYRIVLHAGTPKQANLDEIYKQWI